MSLFVIFGVYVIIGFIGAFVGKNYKINKYHKKSAQQIREENKFYINYYLPYQKHKRKKHK